MSAIPENYSSNIFINCPFDKPYNHLFEAIIFAIHDCGFVARCAREENDSGDVRFIKIVKIIDECKYGIHDISKADLDAVSKLARFNMPLELGLFLGAQRYTTKDNHNYEKRALVMDTEPYRYQQFISDLAGQDITSHQNLPENVITSIRNFLLTNSKRKSIAGAQFIIDRFNLFNISLPDFCKDINWDREKLTFVEYTICVTEWIDHNPI